MLKKEIIPQSFSKEQLNIQCPIPSYLTYYMDTYLHSPAPPPPIGVYNIGVQLSYQKESATRQISW